MHSGRCNLLIVIDPTLVDPKDFAEIGQVIQSKTRQISVYILSGHFPIEQVSTIDWRLPTFSIGVNGKGFCVPKRGPYFHNQPIDKLVQIETMRKARIRVPKSSTYTPDEKYDPSVWGDFVIVKSRKIAGSSKGLTANLVSTQFLSEPEKFDDPVRSLLFGGDAIVQQYIPTGEHPIGIRVVTFLGRVLYTFQTISTSRLPALDPTSPKTYIYDSNQEDAEQNIERRRSFVNDPAILQTAQKIAKSFPTVPLLGVDLLKHALSGEYYALEVNAGGNSWHFSSPMAVEGRKQLSREQRIAQFGAWDIAAQVLIEKTLYYAK